MMNSMLVTNNIQRVWCKCLCMFLCAFFSLLHSIIFVQTKMAFTSHSIRAKPKGTFIVFISVFGKYLNYKLNTFVQFSPLFLSHTSNCWKKTLSTTTITTDTKPHNTRTHMSTIACIIMKHLIMSNLCAIPSNLLFYYWRTTDDFVWVQHFP